MPKSNASYWKAKLSRNKERDREVDAALSNDGWKVTRLWAHMSPMDAARLIEQELIEVTER
jgi:DNA mismatch endonuclease (patch repair protein)